MKVSELEEKLLAEGCCESNFSVNGSSHDCFCINKSGDQWIVYYSERGTDSEPIFSSQNEEEASDFYFKHITNMAHLHCVGFFKTENEAKALETKLSTIGLNAIRNDMPAYKTPNDPRYRVFVLGKAIFKVREAFGEPVLCFD